MQQQAASIQTHCKDYYVKSDDSVRYATVTSRTVCLYVKPRKVGVGYCHPVAANIPQKYRTWAEAIKVANAFCSVEVH